MIGKRIQELRSKSELSITELADLAGVSKSYLSCIEREIQKNPSLQFLQKISSVLNVDMESLLVDVDGGEEGRYDKKTYQECVELAQLAIKKGLSKEEFVRFLEYSRWRRRIE